MMNQIILAGFGGQGILSMGHFIAHAGLLDGKMFRGFLHMALKSVGVQLTVTL